jgi:hypothetical protein
MVALLLCFPLCGQAHELKMALSTVIVNEVRGELELTHRYYLHDVEHAVTHLFGDEADVFSNETIQNKFIEYVYERIQLQQSNGVLLPLFRMGIRIDKSFLYVYQRSFLPDKVMQLSMQNTVLRDVWNTQINLVNFKKNNVTRTLHFDGNDDWLTVSFEP